MNLQPAPPNTKHFDDARCEFSPYGLTCEKWFPTSMRRPDRHNEIEMNFLPEGSLVYSLAGRRARVVPQHLSVFWAARPHQIVEFELSMPYYVVTIPLATFLRWRLPGDFVHAIMNGGLVVEPRSDRAVLDQELFHQWHEDFRDPSAPRLEVVQLEMEARLRRLAIAQFGSQPESVSKAARQTVAIPLVLSKVEQIARFVVEHCTESIQACDIGKAVGLHPDYAAALFRRAFGITLNQYVIDNRISQAQYLLAATDARIMDVALDCGYQSVSRFNAVFKTRCGCTPREYRISHRGDGSG